MKNAIKSEMKPMSCEDYARLPAVGRESNYGKLVEMLIRRKYSLSDELAVLRQKDVKSAEFTAYNEYAEACKAEAKGILCL